VKHHNEAVMLDRDVENRLPDDETNQCLVVVLRQRLTLALVTGYPNEELVVAGVSYKDAGYGDWSGFYDWLRDSEQRVLGVRYWPDDTGFLLDTANKFSYVIVPESRFYMEIYFSSNRSVNKQKSKDQDFLYDKIFSSETGEYIIVFDTSLLTNNELTQITHTAEADWII
jgi:hypothetical protein